MSDAPAPRPTDAEIEQAWTREFGYPPGLIMHRLVKFAAALATPPQREAGTPPTHAFFRVPDQRKALQDGLARMVGFPAGWDSMCAYQDVENLHALRAREWWGMVERELVRDSASSQREAGTLDKRGADRLALEVSLLVTLGRLDARSGAADALLDYAPDFCGMTEDAILVALTPLRSPGSRCGDDRATSSQREAGGEPVAWRWRIAQTDTESGITYLQPWRYTGGRDTWPANMALAPLGTVIVEPLYAAPQPEPTPEPPRKVSTAWLRRMAAEEAKQDITIPLPEPKACPREHCHAPDVPCNMGADDHRQCPHFATAPAPSGSEHPDKVRMDWLQRSQWGVSGDHWSSEGPLRAGFKYHAVFEDASPIFETVREAIDAAMKLTGDDIPAPSGSETAGTPVQARPLDDWHEDDGPALWWVFPVNEPPYSGSPGDSDWPGYHTHFTPLLVPEVPPYGR